MLCLVISASQLGPFFLFCRGKIVLGYTEAELRMCGTGYQFVHAADMLYCAENHVRSKSPFPWSLPLRLVLWAAPLALCQAWPIGCFALHLAVMLLLLCRELGVVSSEVYLARVVSSACASQDILQLCPCCLSLRETAVLLEAALPQVTC